MTESKFHPLTWVRRFSLLHAGARAKQELTLQEPHRAVEALRRQLVVPERPQELRDDDICRRWNRQGPHVAKDDLDRASPLERLALL